MKKFLCLILAMLCIIPTAMLAGCSDDVDNAERVANRIYYVESCKEDYTSTTDTYKNGVLKIYFHDTTFKVELTNSENPELSGYYTGTYDTDDNIVELDINNRSGIFLTNAESYDIKKITFSTLKYKNKTLKVEDIIDGKLVQFSFKEVEL